VLKASSNRQESEPVHKEDHGFGLRYKLVEHIQLFVVLDEETEAEHGHRRGCHSCCQQPMKAAESVWMVKQLQLQCGCLLLEKVNDSIAKYPPNYYLLEQYQLLQ
jgi:hypothetical protein